MRSLGKRSVGHCHKLVCFGLQHGPATLLDLIRALSQPVKEMTYLFLDPGFGPQADVARHFLPHPIPDSLVPIEVRAITG